LDGGVTVTMTQWLQPTTVEISKTSSNLHLIGFNTFLGSLMVACVSAFARPLSSSFTGEGPARRRLLRSQRAGAC
jgi:hypothetical protein